MRALVLALIGVYWIVMAGFIGPVFDWMNRGDTFVVGLLFMLASNQVERP